MSTSSFFEIYHSVMGGALSVESSPERQNIRILLHSRRPKACGCAVGSVVNF